MDPRAGWLNFKYPAFFPVGRPLPVATSQVTRHGPDSRNGSVVDEYELRESRKRHRICGPRIRTLVVVGVLLLLAATVAMTVLSIYSDNDAPGTGQLDGIVTLSDRVWTDDLNDPQSAAFLQLEDYVCTQLQSARLSEEIIACGVRNFAEGSVVVYFTIDVINANYADVRLQVEVEVQKAIQTVEIFDFEVTSLVTWDKTDECNDAPCLYGGTCLDVSDGYLCLCIDGTTGQDCQTDVDECESGPCMNGATCDDLINMYECTCAAGYEGTHCQTDIDECLSDPCLHGATCNDGINRYSCTCPDGYEEAICQRNIDECLSEPCLNGATCNDEIDMYNCACAAGYEGTHCETDIDECVSDPCLNDATCNDDVNGYTCACEVGYEDTHCETNINDCVDCPCMNDGTCNDLVNDYSCSCVDGYEGSHCETDIDECESSPCLNGATCNDEVNMFTCTCRPGYEGTRCETDIDECLSDPCQNEATCSNLENMYVCACTGGYEGVNCEIDSDECVSNPCQNGSPCNDQVNRYTCTCDAGYEGDNCETDIDECASSPCENGAACVDAVNSYTCSCAGGYEGTHCETEIDECESDPCENGAACSNLVNMYECTCVAGYEGTNCQTEIYECQSDPCQNGGGCIDALNEYSCVCLNGFTGSHCGTELTAFALSYGTAEGDSIATPSDDSPDGPYALTLGALPYYGTDATQVWLSPNGFFAFQSISVGLVCEDHGFPNTAMIGVYPIDHITSSGTGVLYFRETTTQTDMKYIDDYVCIWQSVRGVTCDFTATWAFVATWSDLQPFGSGADAPKCSFQGVVTTDGSRSFLILGYKEIGYVTSYCNSQENKVDVGWTDWSNARRGELRPPWKALPLTSNIYNPGMFIFELYIP